jgi:hypothetical protein
MPVAGLTGQSIDETVERGTACQFVIDDDIEISWGDEYVPS